MNIVDGVLKKMEEVIELVELDYVELAIDNVLLNSVTKE